MVVCLSVLSCDELAMCVQASLPPQPGSGKSEWIIIWKIAQFAGFPTQIQLCHSCYTRYKYKVLFLVEKVKKENKNNHSPVPIGTVFFMHLAAECGCCQEISAQNLLAPYKIPTIEQSQQMQRSQTHQNISSACQRALFCSLSSSIFSPSSNWEEKV